MHVHYTSVGVIVIVLYCCCVLQGPLTPTKLAGKGDTLQRSIATFDAKFPTLTHGTESSSTPAGKVQGSTAAPVTMPTTTDLDFTLSGAWEDYWESQLVERKNYVDMEEINFYSTHCAYKWHGA